MDIAIWRVAEGFCLRLHGSEHWLDEFEMTWLLAALSDMIDNETKTEILGSGYSELVTDAYARTQAKPSLLELIGLLPKAKIDRRV